MNNSNQKQKETKIYYICLSWAHIYAIKINLKSYFHNNENTQEIEFIF